MISFQHVKNVIQKFDGDGEKFFPSVYNCVSGDKHVFPHLSRKCSVLLGYEVANSILAHLNGQHKQDNTNNNSRCFYIPLIVGRKIDTFKAYNFCSHFA